MNGLFTILLKKFPRLGAAMYAFKHGGDRDYLRKALQTDPSVFQFHTFGEKNPDKNIYYIRMGDRGDGFFAEYNRLLMYLFTADKYNMTPVILFTGDYLYAEKNLVNGTENPFEYYFSEPSGVGVKEAKKSRNVAYSEYIHTLQPELMREKSGMYGFTEKYVALLGEINRKYIRINDAAQAYIDKGFDKIKKASGFDRMIGVHFRGTDYRRGLKGHPRYLGAAEEIEAVKKLLSTAQYDSVFVATDDSSALRSFKESFGEKLRCYDDVFRSDSDTSVAFSRDKRENHHYMLGLEVLRDMETLSRCSALVAGLSQVGLAARIRKKSLGEDYRDTIVIDHGIVTDGSDPERYYRDARKH